VREPIRKRWVAGVAACLLLTGFLSAQNARRDPLTAAQVNQIRDLGGFPNERIQLYTKFVDDRAGTIKGLTHRAESQARAHRLENELEEFTALLDELGSNLDQYSEEESDIRKALKGLDEASARWLAILQELPAEPGFKLARTEALDGLNDLMSQSKQLLTEQEAYFKAHPKQHGQERANP